MSDIHVLKAMLDDWITEALADMHQIDMIRGTLSVNVNRGLAPREINVPDTLHDKVLRALDLLRETNSRFTSAVGLLKTALAWGLDGDGTRSKARRKQIRQDIETFLVEKGKTP